MSEHPCILVVEDDPEQMMLYTLLLASHGYRTASAFSAEVALTLLMESDKYAVVLTDLNLPGMSGVDLIRTIHDRQIPVPTILMSNDANVREIANAAGADGWIRKHDDIKCMLHAVATAMPSST